MKRLPFFTLSGVSAGVLTVLLLGAGILLGSRNLRHYDPALLIYTFGALFAAFASAYRYTVWLQRPPTRMYWRRAWQLCCGRQARLRYGLTLLGALARNFVAQRFIRQRGRWRWVGHVCMSWGTILAAAVTFPLVFGWMHFASRVDDPQVYQLFMFGRQLLSFHLQSPLRFLLFNLLNIAAVLVIIGVGMTLHRRLNAPGSVAAQQFGTDLVPLLLLLAVAATGLMLTFSMHALHGAGYGVISLVHAITVIATLLYLPFGKLFHILQRPLHLGVSLYKEANAAAPQAHCQVCGEAYAGALHVADLQTVLAEVDLDWQLSTPDQHYMHMCPRCRRRQVGIWQGRALAPAVLRSPGEEREKAVGQAGSAKRMQSLS
ncbi:MAG: MFS transporter [Candidatus Tectimicrobiota bacterium]